MKTQNINQLFGASVVKLALPIGVLALLLASSGVQAAGRNPNPGVIPPDGTYRGLSYGEWGAQWWSTAFSIPVVDGDHPLFSGGALVNTRAWCSWPPLEAARLLM